MIKRVQSFPPIADRTAETLILGSMPGEASLAAGQYYAHPQNAFWRILGNLLRFDVSLPYAARVRALKTARIAVWDVLHSCTRPGSLDSSIDRETLEANDFATFFRGHPRIRRVFFNGSTAETMFNRHVKTGLVLGRVGFARLPSTSPAHAARTFEDKLNAWRIVLPK
jgi:TDG/mug DNA glycosylase family protein